MKNRKINIYIDHVEDNEKLYDVSTKESYYKEEDGDNSENGKRVMRVERLVRVEKIIKIVMLRIICRVLLIVMMTLKKFLKRSEYKSLRIIQVMMMNSMYP